MVHGGIRYLQQREFRLVYENLAERQRLLDNAPHLVTPLPFLIPLFGRDGVVVEGAWRAPTPPHCGCTTSRAAGASANATRRSPRTRRSPPPHPEHRPSGRGLPLLRRPGRRRPPDPHARPHGGVRVRGRHRQLHPGRPPHHRWRRHVNGAVVRPVPDDEVGRVPDPGPDRGQRLGRLGRRGACARRRAGSHAIRPAKGVHVTVPADRLPATLRRSSPYRRTTLHLRRVLARDRSRVYRHDRHRLPGPLDDPACTPEDVDYLLDAANNVTTSRLTRADVTGVWAGLRPLLARPQGRARLGAHGRPVTPAHRQTSRHGVVTVTGAS